MRKCNLFMGQNPQHPEVITSAETDAVGIASAKNFSKVCLFVLIHVFSFWNLKSNSKKPMEK